MPGQEHDAEEPSAAAKSTAERRRYNRRRPDVEPGPPYYEIFERIASALEGIERQMSSGAVQPPRPREGSSERAR